MSESKARVFVPEVEASERMELRRFLTEHGYEPRCGTEQMAPNADRVAAGIGDAQVVAVALGRVDASVMDAAPDLRLIVKCGIGVDCIDIEAARDRGLPVIRMGGVNFNGVAEWVIGATIGHYRRFVEMDAAVRSSTWKPIRDQWTGLLPGLTGRRLGLYGVGSIGARVAHLALAHGMDVVGFDPYLSADAARNVGVTLVERDELFATVDVVSIHAVLTPETRHSVSDHELGLMRPEALIVNSARGPILDERALIAALQSGRIAGAALDVFEQEPPDVDNPLLTMPNCLLAPHLAGCTDTGYREIGSLSADLIDRFFAGVAIPPGCVVVPSADLRIAA